jgi:hypothetical protein
VDLILIILVFIAGFGCGYYVRDRLSKRRRRSTSNPKSTKPNLLDFKTTNMRGLWHALRNRLPLS